MSRANSVCFFATAAIAGAVFSFIGANRVWAQGATATILGTVTDMSGAGVPEASVQIKNTQTGAVQNTTSDAQGRFRVAELPVGNYDAQAAKEGFSTVVRKEITLAVGSQTVVDFALPVGQQQQTITVEGEVSQVETTNAAIGQYTSQQQMAELPLNGRNFEQLILLSPGVAPVTWSQSALQGRALQYSVAGGRPEGQAILLDDQNLQNFWNNGMGSITGSSLGVEAIGEFQTLTNAYGAQFGGNGAVINAVSKTGTNDFHGTAFDYLRNSALDARDFFSTKSDASPYRRNQFGGSLGGPVKKDRAFFFVDYEGIRQFYEELKAATVPNCTAGFATGPCAIASSVVPGSVQYQAIVNTLRIFPKPDTLLNPTTGISTQYGNQINHEDYALARFDYNISGKDSLFLRYYIDKADFTEPFGGANITGGGPLPYWHEADQSTSHFATIEERHLFSPTVVNVARVAFSRPTKASNESTIAAIDPTTGQVTSIPIGTVPAGCTPGVYCPQTPLQFFPQASGLIDGLVALTGGYSNIGGGSIIVFNLVQNRYTFGDDILWTRGAHSLRFGFTLDRSQANTTNPLKQNAIWRPSLAQLAAGGSNSTEGVIPSPTNNPFRDYRETDFAPYVQDDWKVSPKLSLNLGVRWAFYTNPTVLHNELYELPNVQTSTSFAPFSNVFGNNPSLHNIDPRIGIAYDPFADHKTAIRAGFGMFHNPITGLNYQVGLQASPPWPDSLSQNLATAPLKYPFAFLAGTGTSALPTATSGWNRSQNNATPYVTQYNLNIQREILPNTVLTLAYVGSKGTHLFTAIEDNPPIPQVVNGVQTFGFLPTPTTTSVQAYPRINPALGSYVDIKPISDSRYNSLQVLVSRRFSQNLQAQLNYTYSKCIDDGAFGVGSFVGQGVSASTVENPYNQAIDRGVCTYDLPHVLRVNALYALPFKANRVVSGWQLSGIVSRYSGTPFNIADGVDLTGFAGNSPRPNYVSGCDIYANQSIGQWYNPNCFTLPAAGQLGNVGRNIGRGPAFFDADLAILKDTKITERLRTQFRAEFFNIFNHENFATPNASIFSAIIPGGTVTNPNAARNGSAGVINATNQGSTPRQIQFALKFLF